MAEFPNWSLLQKFLHTSTEILSQMDVHTIIYSAFLELTKTMIRQDPVEIE